MPDRGDQARRRSGGPSGPQRPRWPLLAAGGLVYAGALLGVWIVLAGEPDVSDLIAGSAAAGFAVSVGYLLSDRGKMVPAVRAADVRALAAVPWQVVAESGQLLALAARKAAGRPVAAGRLRTVPVDVGAVDGGWPAARREALLTGLLSAAPNTIVVDIDTDAGTALVHRLIDAPGSDDQPAGWA